MTEHVIKWFAAAPLWDADDRTGLDPGFARPAILRFASDSFMDEYLAALERDPARIRTLAVRHETWRKPMEAGPAADLAERNLRVPERPLALHRMRLTMQRRLGRQDLPSLGARAAGAYKLKLYQPAHQRYYLVAATLACELAGLPDRGVDAGKHERVAFVLRRLLPKAGLADKPDDPLPTYDPVVEQGADPASRRFEEYAFVAEPHPHWKRLSDPGAALAEEERLPLFPAAFTEARRKRRIFAGLVPCGRREAYMAAPPERRGQAGPPQTAQGEHPALLLFSATVLEPWKALIARAETLKAGNVKDTQFNAGDDPSDPVARLRGGRGDAQQNSWLLLMDLVEWLADNVPAALTAIRGDNYTGSGPDADLARALRDVKLDQGLIDEMAPAAGGGQPASAYRANLPADLAGAVKAMDAHLAVVGAGEALEAHTQAFPFPVPRAASREAAWPPFLFLFADAKGAHLLPPLGGRTPRGATSTEIKQDQVNFLFAPACRALGLTPDPALPVSDAALAAAPDMREGWFVIRCLYERPECGPLHATVVSAPTDAFQIAGFFDPDAPARPIRIALPIDTTPAGLRKFDRKTMFMVSDILCGQIDRMRGLTLGDLVRQVLPWPLKKDINLPERAPCNTGPGQSLGLMCSLSIPIVTICALILLMIIVSLLDFIFRWLPYLALCLPIPGFKAKR